MIKNDSVLRDVTNDDLKILKENPKEFWKDVFIIGAYAFLNCTELSNIEIPGKICCIEEAAFLYCENLEKVIISEGVTEIGQRVFKGCKKLKKLIIPSSATYISDDICLNCESLKNIVVDKNNPVYDSRENCNAIIETKKNNLFVAVSNSVIPSSVTSIGNGAFNEAKGLEHITLSSNIKTIGRWAFNACEDLKSIFIPSSVTSIGLNAFKNCKKLERVILPEGLDISNCGIREEAIIARIKIQKERNISGNGNDEYEEVEL